MCKVSGFATLLAVALSWFAVSCSGPIGVGAPTAGMGSTAAPVGAASSAPKPVLASGLGAGVSVPTTAPSAVAPSTQPASSVMTTVSGLLALLPAGSEMFFLFILTLFFALGCLSLLVSRKS